MQINFRQGIVKHQTTGFLSVTNGNVSLLAGNTPVIVSVAHRTSNYTFTETRDVANAWSGPFNTGLKYYLYWDFNTKTLERTFGYTTLQPIVSPSEPDAEDTDGNGQFILQVGRHWYNTTTNQHFVWQGNSWSEVLRVFAAQLINGSTIVPFSGVAGTFTGTQIGNNALTLSGRPVFDQLGSPIRRQNGTFFTTEDHVYFGTTDVESVRLESNVTSVQFPQNNVAAYSVVAWYSDDRARPAQYDDTGTTVVGLVLEDVGLGGTGSVILQGTVSSVNWSWTSGTDAVPVGSPLWVENGSLVPYDPHVRDVINYPIGRVPVARVLGNNTVIFEQGLGGKGDRGPTGSVSDLPLATTEDPGGVTLTVPSSNPELALVPSDNDPRLYDARTPLPHNHAATSITFPSYGNLTQGNTDGALKHLEDNKLNKSGGTMTGSLTLSGTPTNANHAVTKQYVDSFVSGIVWLDPICLVNLISDNVTTPPVTPELSDAYIVPVGATGAWVDKVGNIVIWDGTQWLDRGTVLDVNPTNARLGIAMTSSATPSGSFAGQKNTIALFDSTGTLTGFQTPQSNNAVYVCNAVSLNAYNQYVFDGTHWQLFGGGQSLAADNVTIDQTGNILSVIPASAGGEVDAKFWQGLEPTDLDSVYANITHTHTANDITNNIYTSAASWGTLSNSEVAQITSTTLANTIKEIFDKKAAKNSSYGSTSDLPSPTINTAGMVAVSLHDGDLLYSTPYEWVPVAKADHVHTIPFDISMFVAGFVQPNTTLAMFVSPRDILVDDLAGHVAVARVAPLNDTIFELTLGSSGGTTNVGIVEFVAGSTVGNVMLFPFVVEPQSYLVLESGPTSDTEIKDIAVTLIGCAEAIPCDMIPPTLPE